MTPKTLLSLSLLLPLLALAPACDGDEDSCDSGGGGSHGDGGDDGGGGPGGGDDDDDDDDFPGDDDDDFPGDDDDDDFPGDDDDDDDDDNGGGADLGDECMSDDDCASNICLFSGGSPFGFCSQVCEDVFDCPSFWECIEVSNASAMYCAPD